NRVMRVLPRANEAVNECWLSDKDRFSYEGLNSEQRLARPMIRRDGTLQEVDWQTALDFVVAGLRGVRERHGAAAIGALASPHSTLEEMFLLQRLVRSLGSGNVDFRLRQSDFAADGRSGGVPWLGMPVADIGALDRVVIVGSTLRKDHPLLAQRIRQAAKKSLQVNIVGCVDDDLLMRVANRCIAAPSLLPGALAQVLKAACESRGVAVPEVLASLVVSDAARRIAESLVSGVKVAVLLGNLAQHHPKASQLHAIARKLAEVCGARLGFLGEAANSVGGYLVGAVPFGASEAGMNARAMLESPRKAYLLLHAEPELDCQDGRAALAAMSAAEFVVALSPFQHGATQYAQALLPIAPFTETSGTYVSTEGRVQSFRGVVQPLGEARPGWRLLRVLGTMLGLDGFTYESSEAVKADALRSVDIAGRLSNELDEVEIERPADRGGDLERIGEVPIYHADAIVRRAPSLQLTRDGQPPMARMASTTAARLGLRADDTVRLKAGDGAVELPFAIDEAVPDGCVRVSGAHASTVALGPLLGTLAADRVAREERKAG
ncbi:MAG: molybdopterin-dependent oxidoreductase, partial [Microbacteriaceae bacterium]|nr:molybdopterin-dependent oxidoreductase [Microbacteriaceae bacterium]